MKTLRTMALTAMVAAAAATALLGADIIEQILVKVNGEIITKTDLEQRQVAAIRQKPEAQSLRGDDAAVARLLAEVTPQVIVDAVDELLLIQRGKELGYAMGDEQFQSILANIRKENKIESEEQFQAALTPGGAVDARPAPPAREADDRQPRPADRGDGQDRRHRRRGEGVLRRQRRLARRAGQRDAARDPGGGGEHRGRGQRRGRRGGRRQGRRLCTSASSPASRSPGSPPTCRTRRRRPTAGCWARSSTPTWRRSCRRRSTR